MDRVWKEFCENEAFQRPVPGWSCMNVRRKLLRRKMRSSSYNLHRHSDHLPSRWILASQWVNWIPWSFSMGPRSVRSFPPSLRRSILTQREFTSLAWWAMGEGRRCSRPDVFFGLSHFLYDHHLTYSTAASYLPFPSSLIKMGFWRWACQGFPFTHSKVMLIPEMSACEIKPLINSSQRTRQSVLSCSLLKTVRQERIWLKRHTSFFSVHP